MSWNDFEYSVANGQPLSLYEFVRGGVVYHRYTNADRNIDFNDVTWEAISISDSGMSAGTGDNLEITVPADNPVAMLFRGTPPSSPVRVRIHRLHAGDNAFKTVWVATVSEVKREGIERCKLLTASLASTFTRNGLRLTYSRACPYSLYDHNCRVNPEQFGVVGLVIQALDGSAITVNLPGETPDDWFTGGFIEWFTEGVRERRGLGEQSGQRIKVIGGTSGMRVGTTVTLFPGCNRTIDVCEEKFANHLNYGGVPHMPGKSPYTIIKLF